MVHNKTGRFALIEQLLADDIHYMFGNPGTVEQGFLDALGEYPAMHYILTLQETIAVLAADGSNGRGGENVREVRLPRQRRAHFCFANRRLDQCFSPVDTEIAHGQRANIGRPLDAERPYPPGEFRRMTHHEIVIRIGHEKGIPVGGLEPLDQVC